MNFDEFVKNYNGKAVDYDGGYGVQCVDLIKLYADKVFNLKFGAFGNAHAYYDNFENIKTLRDNFDKIPNTAKFVPQKGDIIVWNKNRGGGCGHIAICNGIGTTGYFCSYDQNWNGKKAMQLVKHSYSNVYGVLRPKNQSKLYGEQLSKYKAGQAIEVHIPVALTGAKESNDVMVDSKGYQFWVHKSVIKNGQIIARATICFASGNKYIIQIFNRQFWCDENYIVKKL